MPELTLTFAEYLMIERRRLGMNGEDFADALGISRSTLARWELGQPCQHSLLADAALDPGRPADIRELAAKLLAAAREK